MTRREALQKVGTGFGMVGLANALAAEETSFGASLDPKAPHFAPKAKQVIFLFLNGGPSQVDTFDPKPALKKYHGQPIPGDYPKAKQERGTLMQSPFSFSRGDVGHQPCNFLGVGGSGCLITPVANHSGHCIIPGGKTLADGRGLH